MLLPFVPCLADVTDTDAGPRRRRLGLADNFIWVECRGRWHGLRRCHCRGPCRCAHGCWDDRRVVGQNGDTGANQGASADQYKCQNTHFCPPVIGLNIGGSAKNHASADAFTLSCPKAQRCVPKVLLQTAPRRRNGADCIVSQRPIAGEASDNAVSVSAASAHYRRSREGAMRLRVHGARGGFLILLVPFMPRLADVTAAQA